MPIYSVRLKTTQEEVFRYESASAVEWIDFPYVDFDHVELPPVVIPPAPYVAEDWYIGVGPFWDRFGAYKVPILASTDPLVQAVIKDSSVRKYLDLKGRRADLLGALNLLISKGFPLNTTAILDTQPGPQEVYRG